MRTFKMKINIWVLLLAAVSFMLIPACDTSKAVKGGAIGAAVGGAAGAAIGSGSGDTAVGAILGAAIGGAAGAIIGDIMDRQAEDIEDDLENAEVTRVGEGILINFDSGLLFDFDSYALRNETMDNLDEFAETIQQYEDTEILIEGHTDAKGPKDYNQELSVERAQSVADFLTSQGVSEERLVIRGYGESQPVATNETPEGRQQNRRVEIAIYADEEMREAAKEGRLQASDYTSR